MIKINLLPHRQLRRAEKQREFGWMAVLVVVATAALCFVAWSVIKANITTQQGRNQRLQDEIAHLDQQIVAISGLKTQIQRVLERKQIVERLQSDRNLAVQVLDELARLLPEGIYLTSVKQTNDEIALRGMADTNARVAQLVHNYSLSQIVHDPNLLEIKATHNQPDRQQFEFMLKLSLTLPKPAPSATALGKAATPSAVAPKG